MASSLSFLISFLIVICAPIIGSACTDFMLKSGDGAYIVGSSWHVTNLRNYINLSALNAKDATVGGSLLSSTGQGTGLLGIPGDWTPSSRFVRHL